jgi:hypothetical protein
VRRLKSVVLPEFGGPISATVWVRLPDSTEGDFRVADGLSWQSLTTNLFQSDS